MKEIIKPYNEYATMHYKLAYSTDTRKRVKATHYCCYYGDRCLTNPTSYALCQENLKQYKMMGVQFPDKTKFSIKPAKT